MTGRARWILAAVALQFAVVLAVPLEATRIRATGRTVHVEMVGVDPYSLLSGYYVALAYPWSTPDGAAHRDGDPVYVLLEERAGGLFAAVKQASAPLTAAGPKQVVIRGRYARGRNEFGLERYYVPETKRHALERRILALTGPVAPNEEPRTARPIVELKVTDSGTALVTALWIEGEKYSY